MKSTLLIDAICEALLQVSALLKEILTIAKEFDMCIGCIVAGSKRLKKLLQI